jgi:PAS domain S-box-containing protein
VCVRQMLRPYKHTMPAHSPPPFSLPDTDGSDRFFRQLLDEHQAVMLLIEPDTGDIVEANAAAAAFYGFDHATLCSLNIAAINQLPPDEIAAQRQRIKLLGRNDRMFPHRLANGEIRSVEVLSSPIHLGDRTLLFSIIHDITERHTAEDNLRQLAQRLTTLNEIGQAITSTLDLDQMLIALLDHTRQAVGAEACLVALIDSASGDLVLRQAVGIDGRDLLGQRLRHGQGVAGWVAEHKISALIDDAARDPRFFAAADQYFGFVTRNLVCVPMFAHNAIIGVLDQINKHLSRFNAADVQLLEAAAAQVAVAIDNARLFETERHGRQRIETVYRISQTVNSTLDPAAILDQLIDEAMRATRATHGSVLMARLDQGIFERLSLRGYSSELVEQARRQKLALDHGLNGRAYQTHQVIAVDDVRLDPDYFPLVPDTRSEVVVPILHGDAVLGHIDLQSPVVGGFREVDVDFLRVLADQVAIALENARLYQEAQQQAVELEQRVRDRTAALRASEETARVLLDAAPDAAYLLDAAGTVLAANELGARHLAVALADLIGANILESFEPAGRAAWRAPIDRALSTGQPERFEDARLGRYFEATLYPIHNAAGRIDRVALYANDVTDRRRAEDEMRRALAQEKELNELKSRFISIASHEFRTPMTTILTSAEMLEHYSHRWTDAKKLDYLRRIQTAVLRMVELVNDVLIVGKSDAGKQDFDPAPLNLIDFCRTVVDEAQPDAAHSWPIHFEARGDCAAVVMDERLLRQILSNLLSNACKYSPAGRPVEFNLICRADYAIFEITDHGLGIPPADLPRLYETFHRAGNVSGIPGTGLGMTIVKRAVDRHGGSIEVDSRVGEDSGTTFTVTLPTHPAG